MARSKVAKSRRPQAERAAEHYLYEICGCDPAQICRAIRTKWQAVDYWGCDVWGRTLGGHCWYAQVTAGQAGAVRERRRKLEKISWNKFDAVLLLQLVEQQNPANARRKDFFFRVHTYWHIKQGEHWTVADEACPVPAGWFKKLRIEEVLP